MGSLLPPWSCACVAWSLAAQSRVLEYFNLQWSKHNLLVGEDALSFMDSLSEPLQKEILLFLVSNHPTRPPVPFRRFPLPSLRSWLRMVCCVCGAHMSVHDLVFCCSCGAL